MPGAGGMLLQAILAQNPIFCALGHSPIFEFFHGISSLGTKLAQDPSENTKDITANLLQGLLDM